MSDKMLMMGDMNQEPSMEEILASIKRVIAEDGGPAGRPNANDARGRTRRIEEELEDLPADLPEEDILELDDPVADSEGLLSEDSAAASRQSLAALARMKQGGGDELPRIDDSPLEAVVREMLRPMLKQWLDQRLPEMVEEMVSREIARITGKRL
jgi:cell pole-organizing protein PopZ